MKWNGFHPCKWPNTDVVSLNHHNNSLLRAASPTRWKKFLSFALTFWCFLVFFFSFFSAATAVIEVPEHVALKPIDCSFFSQNETKNHFYRSLVPTFHSTQKCSLRFQQHVNIFLEYIFLMVGTSSFRPTSFNIATESAQSKNNGKFSHVYRRIIWYEIWKQQMIWIDEKFFYRCIREISSS